MALATSERANNATQPTNNNIGAVPSTVPGGLTALEYGDGIQHRTVLNFGPGFYVTVGNTTGISFGSQQIYTFPQGRILVEGVLALFSQIAFNAQAGGAGTIAEAGSGDYSIGSTATADGTLNSTDVDLLPSSAMLDPFVAGLGSSAAGTALAAAAQFDGTSAAKAAYLNVIVDDADVSDAASGQKVYFVGSVQITWKWLGDY